ncbi:MAG: HAD family hydrolase [Pyrinomonadaceae bacterium]|nr:HAD family hydrolase [Pyrinomonadaceae bacterium]
MDTKLLILDIDETLVYAAEERLERKEDFIVGQYFVYERPFLKVFLQFCFDNFEVAVWTSSTRNYAEQIIAEIIEPTHIYSFLWARERCTISFDPEEREHYYEKKMHKIRKRKYDLNSVIVVDDSPEKWRNSYGNLVRVKPFFGEPDDDELKHLIIYLERLKKIENIRSFEKRNWRNRL